jgi:hypothetical protein
MNLKSFGCSFIFGSELSDEDGSVLGQGHANYSRLTWVAYLAQKLNYDYSCHARPGSGNLQIAEQILSHLATNEHVLYVIGWTYIDRFDYVNINNPTKWSGIPWSTLLPVDVTDPAKTYYRDLHSEIRDKLTTLMSIRVVIDTLKQKNCPFIMTYMDELMFDRRWHTTPAITDLQDYIRPHMTTFEGTNFQQWSKKNGHAITDIGHPLESAHAAAGELMIKVFDTQNTIDH